MLIVSVVIALKIDIDIITDRRTEIYQIHCPKVRLTIHVKLMFDCCEAYFPYFDYSYFKLTMANYTVDCLHVSGYL